MSQGGWSRLLGIGVLCTVPLGAAGCGGGSGGNAAPATQGTSSTPGGGGGNPGGGAGRTVNVEVAAVERGRIAREVTVSGVVEPIRSIAVNSQLAGALLAVLAEEGVVVAQGAVLARVDDRELRAQLNAAEAGLQVAEAAYERAARLRDRRVITLPEYERDRTALVAARSQVDQLRTRAGYATVRAPIRGVVTEKNVEAGDIVANNQRLFTIADVSEMVVRVGVSELDVVALNVGEAVRVGLDAYPGQALTGRIRRIFPSADPGTRLVTVEVSLSGPAAAPARPGFLARATFGVGARDGVLLVPTSAVLPSAAGPTVFMVIDGRAIRRVVETGATSAGRVEIMSGLSEGDQIVTVGTNQLRDGADVRIVTSTGRAPLVAEERGGR